MSKKKVIKTATAPAVSAEPVRPSAIVPLLEKHSIAIAIAFVVIALIRIVSTYSQTFATFDEPTHLGCGLQYLAEHKYQYEPQHPPLSRAFVALGPFLRGSRPLHTAKPEPEGVNLLYASHQPEATLTAARQGVLPFFILSAAFVYLWARRYFGPAAAALSTALFTLVPTVLAHSGLATTDMALVCCLTAAFFMLLLWAEKPSWRNSVLFGIATGLAVCCKFTALGFFPAGVVFAALAWLAVARPRSYVVAELAKTRALPFAVAVGTGFITIWAVYLFSFGKPEGWGFSVPFPELFDGVAFASYHNSRGHAAYFLGEIRNKGWWYFFPVMYLYKTPIAWLILLFVGIFAARRRPVAWWMPLAYAAGVMIPSMTSNVNIGTRHVLPMTAGLAIIAGLGLLRLIEDAPAKNWAGPVAALLSLWLIVSGALQHPNYLAYFNEIAGNPDQIVTDSDYDWGQDTIRLARRVKQLGINQIYFSTFTFTPAQLAVWPGIPGVHNIEPLKPEEGWTAASPTLATVGEYGLNHRYERQGIHPWFNRLQPTERVGALRLYYVPPGSLQPPTVGVPAR
jgi:4-amino-4-deoxy-L-arabinose transferase-like glycosyltransferase